MNDKRFIERSNRRYRHLATPPRVGGTSDASDAVTAD